MYTTLILVFAWYEASDKYSLETFQPIAFLCLIFLVLTAYELKSSPSEFPNKFLVRNGLGPLR